MFKIFFDRKGFTLIEMLVSVSIILLLVGIGIVNYLNFNNGQVVLTVVDELKTHLKSAQTKSLAGDLGGCSQLDGYQVTLTPGDPSDTLALTPNCAGSSSGSNVKSYTLPANINVSPFDIIFKTLHGGVCLELEDGNCIGSLANLDISVTYGTKEYQFTITEGGEVTAGAWISE